jgi:hypothetical protein
MSSKPLSKANRIIAGKKPVNKFRTRQRRVLIISAAFGLALSVGILLGTDFSIAILSQVLSRSSNTQPDTGVLRGDVVFETDKNKRCRTFDNKTGQMTDSACQQKVEFYANGVPVPRGTIERLEAISKSFSSR